MLRRLLPLLLGCLLLAGCVEAEETWALDGEGGGIYALTVRWDAELWRRVGEVLGPQVMRRVATPGFPLRAAQWRDSLKDLQGVEVLALEESLEEGGVRRLSTRLKFRRVADLLRWEVLAGRRMQIEPPSGDAGARRLARLSMEPIVHVPVLDRVAALAEAPPAAADPAAPLDPPPLVRLGLDPEALRLVGAMLKPALERVVLRVRCRLPGPLVSVRGRLQAGQTDTVDFTWSFDDLRRRTTDRTVRLRWDVRDIDRVFPVGRR